MLSPNTLLNKARYRVDRLHLGGTTWNVYAAFDQTTKSTVLVTEHQTEPVVFPEHEGLLKTVESFLMNGRRYDVTEPVELGKTARAVHGVWDDFSIVLMALNAISAIGHRRPEISPASLATNAEGSHKLLPLATADANVEIEAWHIPIERIWNDLDHISQRAIYNAWDEESIGEVERSLDESSDLYSAAALFYHAITGTTPPSAFERVVVCLDENDPLLPPQALRPELGDEAGAFLLRCLELRRERRFRSFEEAIMNLPTLTPADTVAVAEEDIVLDLATPEPEPALVAGGFVATEIEPTFPAMALAGQPREEVDEEKLPVAHPLENVPFRRVEAEIEVPAKPETPIFALETPRKTRTGLKLAIAGLILAAGGGIGWAVYQFADSASVAASVPTTAQVAAPVARHEPTPLPTQIPNDQPAVPPIAVSADIPAETTQPETSKSDTTHQRPQVAKAVPKPTAAADAKPKKKVTVDDLINDN